MEDVKVKVLEVKKVADFTKSFVLEKPEGFEYKAGDHGYIEITPDKGKPFSFVSSPHEGIMEFATIIRDQSEWKQELNRKNKGDELILSGPYGKFGYEDSEKDVGFVAGGIGITPFMGILRYINFKKLDTKVTLLYSARNLGAVAFKDELDSLVEKNPNIKIVYTITDDENYKGNKGRVDKEFIEKYSGDVKNKIWYIAGPPKMVIAINKTLKNLNVEKIKLDSFGGY
jgi:glycine betaine catabolism B